MLSVDVILNTGGGSYKDGQSQKQIIEGFASAGLDASIHLADSGSKIKDLTRAAIKNGSSIIVAGGGDGTVSTVAAQLIGTKIILGVLPLGTLNNFSKDLRIPQDLAGATRVIAEDNVREIDTAEVNGQRFINNSSIGLYPQIVRHREERQRLGYGKWRSAFWAAMRIFRLSPLLKVGITIDGKFLLRKVPFVFVGNNKYGMDIFNIGRRLSIADGQLSVYLLRRTGRIGLIILLLRTITGTLEQWEDFEEILTDHLTIQNRRKRIPVACDGEVFQLELPLEYKIIPNSLRVLVPKDDNNA